MDYIFLLYLTTRLNTIHGVFLILLIIGIFILISALFVKAVSEGTADFFRTYPASKHWLIFAITTGAIGVSIVPTQKDAMFIAAGIGVIEAAKAVQGSEIARSSVAIIETWLQKQEKELKK